MDVTGNETSLKLLDVSRYNTADDMGNIRKGGDDSLKSNKMVLELQAAMSIKFAIAYIESNQFLLTEVKR